MKTPTGFLTFSAEQLSSEAAQDRADKRKQSNAKARKVVGQAREILHSIASELQDVPTDMPDSDAVKRSYESAFDHMRREEWEEVRAALFDLGTAALGWAARIDLAEVRDAEEKPRRGARAA